jgi:hypothetical protein
MPRGVMQESRVSTTFVIMKTDGSRNSRCGSTVDGRHSSHSAPRPMIAVAVLMIPARGQAPGHHNMWW